MATTFSQHEEEEEGDEEEYEEEYEEYTGEDLDEEYDPEEEEEKLTEDEEEDEEGLHPAPDQKILIFGNFYKSNINQLHICDLQKNTNRYYRMSAE